jgi:hypothetical protein
MDLTAVSTATGKKINLHTHTIQINTARPAQPHAAGSIQKEATKAVTNKGKSGY